MARGFQVLEAAIEDGRLIRCEGRDSDRSWMHWQGKHFVWEDGTPAFVNLNRVWEDNWEIGPPVLTTGLTFEQARVAMDRCDVVARGARRFRIGGNGYVMWCEHANGNPALEDWNDVAFDYDDIHADDWRIVSDVPREGSASAERSTVITPDERPTVAEAQAYLNRQMSHQLVELTTRWPALFRKED